MRKGSRQPEVRSYQRETAEDDDEGRGRLKKQASAYGIKTLG
jgi:hypothetical protein